ncbi:MAG: ribose 5-phosphate isomerase B [Planctomycetota bacterium]
MRIAIGSDHRGVAVVDRLIERLEAQGHEVTDSCDYPESAWSVARCVADGQADRGILVCGSGIGVSMAANKVAGVRAALVHDAAAAEMTRRHNDANVVCLSAERTDPDAAEAIVAAFLTAPFEGGRHARRVAMLAEIEAGRDPALIGA